MNYISTNKIKNPKFMKLNTETTKFIISQKKTTKLFNLEMKFDQ